MNMDALAAYGSDSDASSSSDAPPPPARPLLPPPQGSTTDYLTPHLQQVATNSRPTTASDTTASTSPPLAETLRSQTSFRNPHHVLQTAEALHIGNFYGSEIGVRSNTATANDSITTNSMTTFALWEKQIVALEEEARAAVASAP